MLIANINYLHHDIFGRLSRRIHCVWQRYAELISCSKLNLNQWVMVFLPMVAAAAAARIFLRRLMAPAVQAARLFIMPTEDRLLLSTESERVSRALRFFTLPRRIMHRTTNGCGRILSMWLFIIAPVSAKLRLDCPAVAIYRKNTRVDYWKLFQ